MDENGREFIKPSQKNIIIRDPITRSPLSTEGEWKTLHGREGVFWRRRLNDGSAVVVEQKKQHDSEKEFKFKKEVK